METHMNHVPNGNTRRAFLQGTAAALAVPLMMTARTGAGGDPAARRCPPSPPTATPSPGADATDVYEDVVVKVGFSAPVTGLDATTWTLTDAQGTAVPASVAQIGEATWGLFPHQVVLRRGETYTARVAAAVCDFAKNCLRQALTWRFTITPTPGGGQGDTRMPLGGGRPAAREETQAIIRPTAPVSRAHRRRTRRCPRPRRRRAPEGGGPPGPGGDSTPA